MANFTDINTELLTINNDIILVEDEEAIANAIVNRLTTQKGTMPTDPDFGIDLEEILFQQQDEITYQLARELIAEELTKEERIDVTDIQVEPTNDTGNQIIIYVFYEIASINNLVTSTTVTVKL